LFPFATGARCSPKREPWAQRKGEGRRPWPKTQNLQPQVILIGLDTPGPTGLETIPRLRKVLPNVGIIALTLLEGNAYRQAALAAGAGDVVRKAELTTDLLPAIRHVTQANRSR